MEKASGEAEAELACLIKFGIIDAVLTDDGDALVFGATQIIRRCAVLSGFMAQLSTSALSPDLTDSKDEVTVYTADAISTTAGVPFTRGGILLIALLSGGDYDTVRQPQHLPSILIVTAYQAGIPGFGASTARGLAQRGLGDSLLRAALGERSTFPQFVDRWRKDICEQLCADSGGHLGKRFAGLSTRVPRTFPDVDIMDAYVFPYTSWSDRGTGPNLMPLTAQLSDITKIAAFCERQFSWGGMSGMLSKLHNVLWEGVCIRMLCEVGHKLRLFFTYKANRETSKLQND
jgi:Holliday junction resolvase YEN1